MSPHISTSFLLVFLLACGTMLAACGGHHKSAQDDVAAGASLYRTYCAGCHGVEAHGNGPVTPVIGVRPPDLTRITARHGGTFPELAVFQIIDGQADLAAHGPRHMPVWGYEFFGTDADDEGGHHESQAKIDQLVSYLRSIQRTD